MEQKIWEQLAYDCLLSTAERKPRFTSDDVRAELGDVRSTKDERALGAVMVRAQREGKIERTETFTPCTRKNQHGSPRRIWRSLIFAGPADEAAIEFRCKDDPEANGRRPLRGEQRFSLVFPLEDGRSLNVHMGREGMNHFESFVAQMMIDDQEGA